MSHSTPSSQKTSKCKSKILLNWYWPTAETHIGFKPSLGKILTATPLQDQPNPDPLGSISAQSFFKEPRLAIRGKIKYFVLSFTNISVFTPPLMAFLLIGFLMAGPYIWRHSFKVEVSNSCLREGRKAVCVRVCFFIVLRHWGMEAREERKEEWRKKKESF